METYRFDVVVAGGGVSGVCAAIASARAGAKTALIQNRPVLGGNSSSEIRVWTRGSVGGGTIFAEEMGILGELKLHNFKINPDFNPVLWDEALFDKVYSEKNIQLFLNTNITDVAMQDSGKIGSVVGYQLGSGRTIRFESSMFIDATGDGTVGFLAGVNYRFGREDKAEYGESLTPKVKDSNVLGSSIMFQYKDEGKPIRFEKPDYAYDIPYIEALLNKGGRVVNEKMNGCDYWWVEFGGTHDTILENQEIGIELKKLVMGIWNYIKNSGKFNADTLTLEWIGQMPGKRESRRFVGEYTLTQNDVEQGRSFPDAVCYGGWYMDFHPSDGIYSEESFCLQVPVHAYNIPMRSLYTSKMDNLLFAGRNISVSHAAFSSTRIMDTCGLVGQASGTIAAFCALQNCTPHEANQKYITELQQKLLKSDMTVWDLKNTDESDLARSAAVTCSEVRTPESLRGDGLADISGGTFLVCPVTKENARLTVAVECEKDTELEYAVYESRLPSRLIHGSLVGTYTVPVRKGQETIELDLSAAANPIYVKIVFQDNSDVKIKTTSDGLTGLLLGRKERSSFESPCVSAVDCMDYGCENVVNGYNRIEYGTNLWSSGSLEKPQWLEFTWEQPKEFSQIRMTFNPDLSSEIPSSISKVSNDHHGFVRGKNPTASLVKAFHVDIYQDGQWQKVAAVNANTERLCIVNMPVQKSEKIRICFDRTYGSPYAEVFEVRIY
ncbi:MAG TPA: FAD-dependent oxidoreductase [Clostridiales bacterium]|nr:FAD-dependent oxidoreductase [Clostridiales bacterium]